MTGTGRWLAAKSSPKIVFSVLNLRFAECILTQDKFFAECPTRYFCSYKFVVYGLPSATLDEAWRVYLGLGKLTNSNSEFIVKPIQPEIRQHIMMAGRTGIIEWWVSVSRVKERRQHEHSWPARNALDGKCLTGMRLSERALLSEPSQNGLLLRCPLYHREPHVQTTIMSVSVKFMDTSRLEIRKLCHKSFMG